MREQRSLLNFAILIVVSSATAVFVLHNARKAIAEIDVLNSKPIYIARRQFIADDKKIDTSNWKTYRNERYGFAVKYPPDWRPNVLGDKSQLVIQFLSLSAQNGPMNSHFFGPAFDVRIVHDKAYEPDVSGTIKIIAGREAIDSGWFSSSLGGIPLRGIKFAGSQSIVIYLNGTLAREQKPEEALLEVILTTFEFLE